MGLDEAHWTGKGIRGGIVGGDDGAEGESSEVRLSLILPRDVACSRTAERGHHRRAAEPQHSRAAEVNIHSYSMAQASLR